MRTSVLIALLMALVAFFSVDAVPPSRFNRKVDDKKLDEDWADDEDDEWHEDTFEWKRKIAQKKAPEMDLNTLQSAGSGMQDLVLEHEAKSGNMQMAFCTLKKGTAANKFEAEQLGQKWNSLMQTAGIRATLYAISEDDLLFTDDSGVIMKVRDFLLEQPEVEKFRWKDTDFDKEWLAKKKEAAAKDEAAEKERLIKAAKKAAKKSAKKTQKGETEEKPKKKGKGKGKKAKKAQVGVGADGSTAPASPTVAEPAAIPIPRKNRD